MPDVVQIKCPACQNALRIPSTWAGQTMRCKHCQHVFQAQSMASPPTVAVPPRPPASRPVAPIRNSVAAAPQDLFAFEEAESAPAATPNFRGKSAARRRGLGTVKALLLGGVVLVGAGTAAVLLLVVLGTRISKMFNAAASQHQAHHSAKSTSAATVAPAETGKSTVGPSQPGKGDPKNDPKSDPKVDPKGDPTADPKVDPKGKDNSKENPGTRVEDAIYPRRALLISVCNYLFEPLHYGKLPQRDSLGSSPRALAARLEVSLDFPTSQVGELSDKAAKPVLPKKGAIEETIADFLATSRSQDCIVLLFSGHAVEIDKEAYLMPIEGKATDPKTLISFDWLFAKLAACKAHQKVLILDIARGKTLGDVLFDKLKKAPADVRVWVPCTAKEQSVEYPDGSLFMEALCQSCKNVLTRPEDLIPVEILARKVDAYIQEKNAGLNHKQTTALLGKDRPGSVPFKAEEKMPPAVAIKAPVVPDTPPVQNAQVKEILDEIAKIPHATIKKLPPLDAGSLEFPAKVIAEYKADYKNLLDFKTQKDKFPLRAAVAEAVVVLQASANMPMRSTIDNRKDKELAVLKQQILTEQKAISEQKLALREALENLEAVGDKRDEETKRWQVLYDFVLLRLKSRYVYVMDYNFILGQFRGDAREDLGPGDRLWRLSPREKVSTNETVYKEMAKEVKKGWEKLAKNFPQTPWAIEAQRESAVLLGLTWRPSKN